MGAGGGKLVGAWLHARRPRRQRPAPGRDAGHETLQGPLDSLTWRRTAIAYGVAHVGKSLLWTASDLLTIYLLVSVYSVDPIVAGGLFLVGLAANALADLGVGIWLGRHPHHAARLAGAGLVLAALVFPATVLTAGQGTWALLAATLAFRIAYAGCDVPHNALMTRLGDSPSHATWLARARTIGTALASLIAAWGVSRSHGDTTAPLLWGLSFAALLIGSAMVPLLAAFPPEPRLSVAPSPRSHRMWLPPRFLIGSITGIVALGALAKAVLHLPADLAAPTGGSTILMLLVAGRTASAFVPLRMTSGRRGLAILAAAYVAAAILATVFAWSSGPVMLILLGLALGLTNLVGWALLPALARGPQAYGLYTMASKLALGAAGLALAGGLGGVPTFTPAAFPPFSFAIAAACIIAALLVWPHLTSPTLRALSAS